ncbi:hypothetical protein BH09BAC6_BH09BAC6_20250 [soil metagenome]|jgi:hypothetical protein
MQILHILNGDSTLRGFEQTGLEGDVIVWREILSQGPLEENISSGSFWRQRREWIGETFHEAAENYQETVIDQLAKLSEPYEEINLWFEFDLHCQANLLGVLMLLKKRTDLSAPAVYLICPADYPGNENFMGMGELNGEELEYLFDNIRVEVTGVDFMLAEEAWMLYVNNNVEALQQWLTKTEFWGNLPLLKPALEAHLKRLQVNPGGLNYIEQKLLDIYNSGIKTKQDIYNAFWQTEKIYGMGDLEIDIYLRSLTAKKLIDLPKND